MVDASPRYGITKARRVVVKIGSALVAGADGAPDAGWLSALAEDVAAMRARGQEVVLVSSGAVAIGRRRLGYDGALRLEQKQAAAAAGQADLVRAYEAALRPHGAAVAQLLLTLEDTESRRRYLNARATLEALLAAGAVPLVNENDTVATAEIRYGDNDRLAAHVAQMASADCLVLLSDIDGLYTADPRADPAARHVPYVAAITPEIDRMAGGVNQAAQVGSGGMRTKLEAARIAVGAGCACLIALGECDRPLQAIEQGARSTLFAATTSPQAARKQWISGRLKPAGRIIVDDGAAAALRDGRSLLAAGVVGAEGGFARGDAVTVATRDGAAVAKGLAAYDAAEVAQLAGRRSEEIEAILGFRRGSAILHRDDLVLADRSEA